MLYMTIQISVGELDLNYFWYIIKGIKICPFNICHCGIKIILRLRQLKISRCRKSSQSFHYLPKSGHILPFLKCDQFPLIPEVFSALSYFHNLLLAFLPLSFHALTDLSLIPTINYILIEYLMCFYFPKFLLCYEFFNYVRKT